MSVLWDGFALLWNHFCVRTLSNSIVLGWLIAHAFAVYGYAIIFATVAFFNELLALLFGLLLGPLRGGRARVRRTRRDQILVALSRRRAIGRCDNGAFLAVSGATREEAQSPPSMARLRRLCAGASLDGRLLTHRNIESVRAQQQRDRASCRFVLKKIKVLWGKIEFFIYSSPSDSLT
jgi:hypothetical protein